MGAIDARTVRTGDVKIGDKLNWLVIKYGTNEPLYWIEKTVTNVTLTDKRVILEFDGTPYNLGKALGLKTLLNNGAEMKWWNEEIKKRGIKE